MSTHNVDRPPREEHLRHYDASLAFAYYRAWFERDEERYLWWSVAAMRPRLTSIYFDKLKTGKARRDLDDLIQIATMELKRSLQKTRPDLASAAALTAWSRRAAIFVFHHWIGTLPKFYPLEEMLPVEPLSGSLSPATQHEMSERIQEAMQLPQDIEDRMLSRVRFPEWIQLVQEINRAQARGGNIGVFFRAFRVPVRHRRFLIDYTTVLRRLAMREIYDEREERSHS